ncbi:MAG: hypothetical protein P4M11_00135 [Candidatus Pacebacteria bacterium]|nr:hypothetical protein [Candidatus Paceibacterota bacterium]
MGSLCYIAACVVLSLDSKGKEAYFAEDPTERTFQEVIEIRYVSSLFYNPKTDNWGYFQIAAQRNDSFWKKYNALIIILVTGGVTGIFWVIIGILELRKYCKSMWNLATTVPIHS